MVEIVDSKNLEIDKVDGFFRKVFSGREVKKNFGYCL
jgi:hypothetical protein